MVVAQLSLWFLFFLLRLLCQWLCSWKGAECATVPSWSGPKLGWTAHNRMAQYSVISDYLPKLWNTSNRQQPGVSLFSLTRMQRLTWRITSYYSTHFNYGLTSSREYKDSFTHVSIDRVNKDYSKRRWVSWWHVWFRWVHCWHWKHPINHPIWVSSSSDKTQLLAWANSLWTETLRLINPETTVWSFHWLPIRQRFAFRLGIMTRADIWPMWWLHCWRSWAVQIFSQPVATSTTSSDHGRRWTQEPSHQLVFQHRTALLYQCGKSLIYDFQIHAENQAIQICLLSNSFLLLL